MSFWRTRLRIIYDLFGWIWLYSFHAACKFRTRCLCGRAAMWWLLNMALQQCVVLSGSGEPIVHSSRACVRACGEPVSACVCVCVCEGERGRRGGMWLGLEEILVFWNAFTPGETPWLRDRQESRTRGRETYTKRERERMEGVTDSYCTGFRRDKKKLMLCCLMQVSCRFQVDRPWQSHDELWTFWLCDFVCN